MRKKTHLVWLLSVGLLSTDLFDSANCQVDSGVEVQQADEWDNSKNDQPGCILVAVVVSSVLPREQVGFVRFRWLHVTGCIFMVGDVGADATMLHKTWDVEQNRKDENW